MPSDSGVVSAARTVEDYAGRVERVHGYLAEHLDGDVDLDRLAAIACFSPFHFHRIYHALQGETIAESVRRMRLHRAAVELIDGAVPIARIAAATRYFGVSYDDPSATPAAAQRSDACLTVPPGAAAGADPDVRRLVIAGGVQAVLLHVGPYAELHRAYTWLYREWLPSSGEEPAHAPCVEEYLNDPRTTPPTELRTEIWLPIRKPTGR
jgi:AraC family transcriptional regulator